MCGSLSAGKGEEQNLGFDKRDVNLWIYMQQVCTSLIHITQDKSKSINCLLTRVKELQLLQIKTMCDSISMQDLWDSLTFRQSSVQWTEIEGFSTKES